MRNIIYTCVFLFVSLPLLVQGQQSSYDLYFTTGVGGTSYKGDLSSNYKSWTGTFHAGLVFNKKKRVNGYLHLMIGNVSGNNDSYIFNSSQTTTPNNYFKTSFVSFGYELRINFLKRESYLIYLSPGFGILRFNPKDEFGNSYENQFTTRAKGEEYSNISLCMPLKIGGTYYFKNSIGIGMDVGFINPLTDYIDNISKWGNTTKKDNLLQANLLIYIPLKKSTTTSVQ
jgi:hypothetical protein